MNGDMIMEVVKRAFLVGAIFCVVTLPITGRVLVSLVKSIFRSFYR